MNPGISGTHTLIIELEMHLSRARREMNNIGELGGESSLDDRTLCALAGHLQAFYTGCETVIGRELQKFDGLPSAGSDSHVRLLQQGCSRRPELRSACSQPLDGVGLSALTEPSVTRMES